MDKMPDQRTRLREFLPTPEHRQLTHEEIAWNLVSAYMLGQGARHIQEFFLRMLTWYRGPQQINEGDVDAILDIFQTIIDRAPSPEEVHSRAVQGYTALDTLEWRLAIPGRKGQRYFFPTKLAKQKTHVEENGPRVTILPDSKGKIKRAYLTKLLGIYTTFAPINFFLALHRFLGRDAAFVKGYRRSRDVTDQSNVHTDATKSLAVNFLIRKEYWFLKRSPDMMRIVEHMKEFMRNGPMYLRVPCLRKLILVCNEYNTRHPENKVTAEELMREFGEKNRSTIERYFVSP